MTKAPAGYRIEAVDWPTAPDALLEQAARLEQTAQKERVPEDPVNPTEVIVQRYRLKPPSEWRASFAAFDGSDRLVGTGGTGYSTTDPGNAHVRWCGVTVAPEHRRKGLGRAIFRRLAESVDGQREDLLFISHTSSRVPVAEAFARALGADPGLPMKTNQLVLADVDRAQIADWARLSPAGYRIERIDGRVPDELMAPYIAAANGMNDAPRGDIAFGDWTVTPENQREREDWMRGAGFEWWCLVAVHEVTGEGAGYTEVQYDPRVAHLIWQQGTATVKAHRGHQIGLWLKAAMLERILAERTNARFIRTGNANVNEHMLRINTQLGYKLAWQSTLWQLKLADARKAVGLVPAEAAAS